ncbi:MAG: ABC transporter permease [Candidatus Cohnella colombiensis]|uniref:ABC transporter permease n=1 Tax=Candidatus Cohnella colombiensis TaxID=3121368 RepID=A0AA95EUZ4_9BACL|nr:MAG: ABC transporter permease [Cohnella sp.]
MSKQIFHNTGLLSRFILRRDRLRIPVWIIALVAFTCLVAISFTTLYGSEQARQAIAESMKNPAMTAMVGIGYGLDNYTFGAMMAHQLLLMTSIVVGIMSILLVTRHTRADEEEGRIEMVRSLPVGRLSNLGATFAISFGTNASLALIIGFGLNALGIESMGLEGSLLYGAAIGAIGIFFAALTALFAQLSESPRGTIGFSFAILGIAYLVRAIGDVSMDTLSWFSPFGWVLSAKAYVHNNWWPIVLTVGVALLLTILAFYLNAIRDLEAGFIPSKPGKKKASSFLQSPLGLSLRLQRMGIIAWAIGMFVLGAAYGSVLGDTDSFLAQNGALKDLITPVAGFSLTELFIAMIMSVLAMICTIPVLMVMFRLKGEEKKNRTEHLLGRAVSRMRLMGSYFIVSIAVGLVMLSLAGLGMGVAGVAAMDSSGITLGVFYQAAIVYLPAIWIMIGLAVLLVGIAPRLTSLLWLYMGYSFLVVYLGKLFQFPDWMSKLTPFGYISQYPIEQMDWVKSIALTTIAIAITVAGFVGYRRRDIQG